MKTLNSNPISAFGGINFVFEYFNTLKLEQLCDRYLPALGRQSTYSWKDILYSFNSIFLCGGDCMEDLHTHLKPHFIANPYVNLTSPDTLLRRLASLAVPAHECTTQRGCVTHAYCTNTRLEDFNLAMLKQLGVFKQPELTLDYDNTILFNEKQDSKMTYKRDYGYQPGVCMLNEQYILYIENRNGNSDAKSFQKQTLERIFSLLEKHQVGSIKHFRADAASYQYEVIRLVEEKVRYFYIGCRNSYVEKYFTQIHNWQRMDPKSSQDFMEVGYIDIVPFKQQAHNQKREAKTYRLIVKRSPRKDAQMNLITADAYQYTAILTNNFSQDAVRLAHFYNRRGNMERQFDILKNDFGWDHMPFSSLHKNLVFLYFAAICRNLYAQLVAFFSQKVPHIRPEYRLKKFLFRFIIMPAKWVKQGREFKLRIYSPKHYYT